MILIGITWRRFVHSGWRAFSKEQWRIPVKNKAKTCGIIVTGDEVLKGEVQDENCQFLCKKLHDLGIRVVRISAVPDHVETISSEVKKFSLLYDYVLTTGGIGPTHDDVTYESVARAFGLDMEHNQVLKQICFDFFKTDDINHPALKIAYIPVTSTLTFGFDEATNRRSYYPNVSVQNVYIFPGVPHMLRKTFNSVYKLLFSTDGKFYFRELYLNVNEDRIIKRLNEAVDRFPEVTFGSYPKFFHSYYSLKLTAESSSGRVTNEAFEYLKSGIPGSYHVDYDPNFLTDKRRKVDKLNHALLNDTIRLMRDTLLFAKPGNVFLYFDGGKNSTILMYVLSLLREEMNVTDQMNCVYTELNDKVVPFIVESAITYDANLIKLNVDNLRRFFSDPEVRLIKGTRRTDPEFEKVSKFFDDLKATNPLLNWNYKDVWDVIRGLYIPYCNLYDQGYSSVCHSLARPNPHLETTGPRKDLVYYKRASELENGDLENVT